MFIARALLGLAVFILLAWAMSSHKRRFPWRVVGVGLALQITLGALILKTAWGFAVFQAISDGFVKMLDFSTAGARMVFGELAISETDEGTPTEVGFVFAFAGSGLAAIIFFSALLALLYHLGVMQAIVWVLARAMSWLMRVSGAESLAMAANIFAGQTEAPLAVRPYLSKMTNSELNALMTGGFATIAGSVLAVYIFQIGEQYATHLITASVMSAPAAFLVAKVMLPETESSETAGHVPFKVERRASNFLEAIAIGTQEGLKLWLNVLAMLIAFVALVAMIDYPLGALGNAMGIELSLATVFGWALAPLAWVIGVESWNDCQRLGSLLGTKIAVNEFIAFIQLAEGEGEYLGFESKRSAILAGYALCGFANFSSIGIQIGGISALVPERRADLARLALRAMLGGAFASWMTATVAGMFIR
ncbi:MAG: nucleoside transporter C-terminal domain-containing protein [Planctomycetota bacterium]